MEGFSGKYKDGSEEGNDILKRFNITRNQTTIYARDTTHQNEGDDDKISDKENVSKKNMVPDITTHTKLIETQNHPQHHYINPMFDRDFGTSLNNDVQQKESKRHQTQQQLLSERMSSVDLNSHFHDLRYFPMSDIEVEGLHKLNQIIDPQHARDFSTGNFINKKYDIPRIDALGKTFRRDNIPVLEDISDIFHAMSLRNKITPYTQANRLSITHREQPVKRILPLVRGNQILPHSSTRRKYIWKTAAEKRKLNQGDELEHLAQKYKGNTLLRDLSKVTMEWTGYKDLQTIKRKGNPSFLKSEVNQSKSNTNDDNKRLKKLYTDQLEKSSTKIGHGIRSKKLVGYLIKPHYGTGKYKLKANLLDVVPTKSNNTNTTSADKKFLYQKVRTAFSILEGQHEKKRF